MHYTFVEETVEVGDDGGDGEDMSESGLLCVLASVLVTNMFAVDVEDNDALEEGDDSALMVEADEEADRVLDAVTVELDSELELDTEDSESEYT